MKCKLLPCNMCTGHVMKGIGLYYREGVYLCCSYSMMMDCWNEDKEARPTFQEIKGRLDSMISYEERYNYMTPVRVVAETAPTLAVERVEFEVSHSVASTDPDQV